MPQEDRESNETIKYWEYYYCYNQMNLPEKN